MCFGLPIYSGPKVDTVNPTVLMWHYSVFDYLSSQMQNKPKRVGIANENWSIADLV